MRRQSQTDRGWWPYVWPAVFIIGAIAIAGFGMAIYMVINDHWRDESSTLLSTDFTDINIDGQLPTLSGSSTADADHHLGSLTFRNEYGPTAARDVAGLFTTISSVNGSRADADGNLHLRTGSGGTLSEAIKINSTQDTTFYGDIVLPAAPVPPKGIYYDDKPAVLLEFPTVLSAAMEVLRFGSNAVSSFYTVSLEAAYFVVQQVGARMVGNPLYDVVTMAFKTGLQKYFLVFGDVYAVSYKWMSDSSVKNVTSTWNATDSGYWYDQLSTLPISNFLYTGWAVNATGANETESHFGLVAQDLLAICPQCVQSLDVQNDTIPALLTVKVPETITLLINSVQFLGACLADHCYSSVCPNYNGTECIIIP